MILQVLTTFWSEDDKVHIEGGSRMAILPMLPNTYTVIATAPIVPKTEPTTKALTELETEPTIAALVDVATIPIRMPNRMPNRSSRTIQATNMCVLEAMHDCDVTPPTC